VRLAAVVDLVLEEVREQARRGFLLDSRAARHQDGPVEIGVGESGAERDEPLVDGVLLGRERGGGVEGLARLEEPPWLGMRRFAPQ